MLFDLMAGRAARVNCVDYIERDGTRFFKKAVRAGFAGVVAKRIES